MHRYDSEGYRYRVTAYFKNTDLFGRETIHKEISYFADRDLAETKWLSYFATGSYKFEFMAIERESETARKRNSDSSATQSDRPERIRQK